jgi:hypothetical protein
MTPPPGARPTTPRGVAAVCLLLLAVPPASAQNQNVWKANDPANVKWSDQNNWTAQVIANGQLAVFSSNSTRAFSSNNDLVGLTIAGIVVNGNNTFANPIVIGGNSFGIAASGVDMSAATTDMSINATGLTLTTGQTWTVAAGRTATVNALVAGSSPAWTISGGGTVRLNTGGTSLGAVQVTGGSLLLGSTSATLGSGTVTANGTGAIGGVGAIVPNLGSTAANRVTVAAGATLTPGIGGVGTLTVGSSATHATAELDGGSNWAVDLASAIARPGTGIADVNTNDRLFVNGIVDFSAGSGNLNLTVNGAGLSFMPGKSYDYFIATSTDGLSGFSPSRFTIALSNFSLPGTASVQNMNNGVLLTYTPVPEASHVFGACLAVTGMAWWVRFWRRQWKAEWAVGATKSVRTRPAEAIANSDPIITTGHGGDDDPIHTGRIQVV